VQLLIFLLTAEAGHQMKKWSAVARLLFERATAEAIRAYGELKRHQRQCHFGRTHDVHCVENVDVYS
jgi:hypothetical protein